MGANLTMLSHFAPHRHIPSRDLDIINKGRFNDADRRHSRCTKE
jgi:hypothetical protein